MSDRAKNACNCDHQCAFHEFKARKVGDGDTCLLITRDMRTMTETMYVVWGSKAKEWCDWFKDNEIDQTRFEELLMQGKTLQEAREALS